MYINKYNNIKIKQFKVFGEYDQEGKVVAFHNYEKKINQQNQTIKHQLDAHICDYGKSIYLILTDTR